MMLKWWYQGHVLDIVAYVFWRTARTEPSPDAGTERLNHLRAALLGVFD